MKEIQPITVGKALWQEHEVATHTPSTVRKHREMNVCIQIGLSSLFTLNSSPWMAATPWIATPSSERVFPAQLISSRAVSLVILDPVTLTVSISNHRSHWPSGLLCRWMTALPPPPPLGMAENGPASNFHEICSSLRGGSY